MVFSFLIMSLNYSNEMLFFSVRKEKRSKFLKRLDLTSQYYSLNCISSLMVVKKKMFHVHRKISISLANNSHDMLFVHCSNYEYDKNRTTSLKSVKQLFNNKSSINKEYFFSFFAFFF